MDKRRKERKSSHCAPLTPFPIGPLIAPEQAVVLGKLPPDIELLHLFLPLLVAAELSDDGLTGLPFMSSHCLVSSSLGCLADS
jgi:hypothetical protein